MSVTSEAYTLLKHAIESDRATTDEMRAAIRAYRPCCYYDQEYRGIKRRAPRDTAILLFGPSGSGKSSFFNSVLCAMTGTRNVGHAAWFPVDQVEHEHKEGREPFSIFSRAGDFTNSRIRFLEIRGPTWVDPDWDVSLMHRGFLGLMEFPDGAAPPPTAEQRQATTAFTMNHHPTEVAKWPVDLVVLVLPATANQREVDYMRVLQERLRFMGIPHAHLVTKQDLLKTQRGPFPLETFRTGALLRVENYRYGGPDFNDEMNRNLLKTLCKLLQQSELNLHVLHDPAVKAREEHLMRADRVAPTVATLATRDTVRVYSPSGDGHHPAPTAPSQPLPHRPGGCRQQHRLWACRTATWPRWPMSP